MKSFFTPFCSPHISHPVYHNTEHNHSSLIPLLTPMSVPPLSFFHVGIPLTSFLLLSLPPPLLKILFIYSWKTQREKGKDIGRGRSRLQAGSLMWESIPRTGIMPKADTQLLSHQASQIFFNWKNMISSYLYYKILGCCLAIIFWLFLDLSQAFLLI